MMMEDNDLLIDDKIEQRAVLVGLNTGQRGEIPIEESMKELGELAQAAGATVLETVIQNKQKIDPALFIGKGKADEVRMICTALDANIVIFDDELSPSQIRNLEGVLETTIVDRTTLILDIFAQRAITKEAKLQVELAQLKYRLPRLLGLGQSLSRTGAGIGTRGPGEQKLEIDKRRILEKITDIRGQLKEVVKNREVQRAQRKKNSIPVVSLVGYTNAGKSTLMNRLLEMTSEGTDKHVYTENMLFATLDTFHRKILLNDNKEFILTDTVGFVSKLPHNLVDAFKATLEEVIESDLLLHVVDASNDSYKLQIDVTEKVLRDLGVEDRKMIYLFNKCDIAAGIIPRGENIIPISALTGENVEKLVEDIKASIFTDIVKCTLLLPYDKGDLVSKIHNSSTVISQDYLEDGIKLECELKEAEYNRYKEFVAE